jgi:hypothetical protein
MRKVNAYNQFMRTVSLLVTLFAIAFSLPSSAHANMMTQSVSQHAHGNDLDTGHDDQVMACGMSHEGSGDGHDGTQCCFGICGDVVALTTSAAFIAGEVHLHDALPYLVMASAERTHLMRPPNL